MAIGQRQYLTGVAVVRLVSRFVRAAAGLADVCIILPVSQSTLQAKVRSVMEGKYLRVAQYAP